MPNYQYIQNFQEDDELIKSYFDFTQKVFSFDLENWRNAGHWKAEYIPNSLICNNQVIANISASIINLQLNKKHTKAIQLGSVGVLEEYRGKGLARILMEKVLNEYKHFPLLFLYASEDVSEFYLRFGFRRVREGIPSIKVESGSKRTEPIKITVESEHIKRLLNVDLQRSSIIDARENTSIYWYHLMYNFSDNIFYIEEKDIIFIARYENDIVSIYDVLSENRVSFDEIKEYILKADTKQVRFDFTPDWLNVSYEVTNTDNDLYVYGEFLEYSANCRFPGTAVT